MLVEILPDIFQSEADYRQFARLFNILIENEKHEIFIDLANISNTQFYKNLHALDKEIIVQAFNNFITNKKAVSKYVSNNNPENSLVIFNLKEAIIYFGEPFKIIIENNQYDGKFIDALITNFAPESSTIAKHKDNMWLEYVNAGGCENVKNVLFRLLKPYRKLPKPNYVYLKCYVVLDSDRRYPDMPLNETRKRLKSYLDEWAFESWTLEKREIENYLPERFVEELEENEDFKQAYKKLTPVQKDYFDLEKGFQKNRSTLDRETAEFFNNLDEKDYNTLRKGLKIDKFKQSIANAFSKNYVTAESLLAKCAHQKDPLELKNKLKEITSLL